MQLEYLIASIGPLLRDHNASAIFSRVKPIASLKRYVSQILSLRGYARFSSLSVSAIVIDSVSFVAINEEPLASIREDS